MSVKKTDNPLLFSLIVTGIFALIVLFGLVHHEMWRDELQAWLVARDAHSVPQLLKNMRYEGNPALWHFFLFIITCFTHNPVYMQAFHFIIACGFIFVFNRYSEIERPYKILFSFGYFTLYEYSVISRSYGLTLLLIVITCALYKNRHSRYIQLGIVLALLANVTVYGIIFSAGFSGILALDYIFFQEKDKKTLRHLITGLIIVVTGIALSVYQILPENDNSFPINYAEGIFEFDRWGSVWSKLFTTYFYVPKTDGINFWNTNCYFGNEPQVERPFWDWLLVHTEYLWFWFFLPAVVFIFSLIIFIRKPLILLLYTGVTIGLLSFYYYTGLIFSRYCGFLLIVLIACYWLAKYYPDKKYKNPVLAFLSGFGKKIQNPFLAIILTTNIAGAAVAYSKDYSYKFSMSKDAADYIHENKLDTMTMTGAYFCYVSPLSAYLDTKLYYFEMNDYGSFCLYNGQLNWNISNKEITTSIIGLMGQGRTNLLLISSYEWRSSFDGGVHFEKLEHSLLTQDIKIDFLKSFEGGIVRGEQYYIYLVHR